MGIRKDTGTGQVRGTAERNQVPQTGRADGMGLAAVPGRTRGRACKGSMQWHYGLQGAVRRPVAAQYGGITAAPGGGGGKAAWQSPDRANRREPEPGLCL